MVQSNRYATSESLPGARFRKGPGRIHLEEHLCILVTRTTAKQFGDADAASLVRGALTLVQPRT